MAATHGKTSIFKEYVSAVLRSMKEETKNISKKNMAQMLFPAILPLLNRFYEWLGGLNFHNNQSKKLKFVTLLSRDSSNQVETTKITNRSPSNLDQRPGFLDRPSGYPAILPEKLMAVIYQNICGLSFLNRERRSVTDESVLFPFLNSLANKTYFQISFLNERPSLFEISPFELKPLIHREYMFSDFQNY